MSEPTLKPCPFCGMKGAGLYITSNAHDAPFVECNDCGSCGPVESTEAEAIESWNHRAEPQEHQCYVSWPDKTYSDCLLDRGAYCSFGREAGGGKEQCRYWRTEPQE